MDASSRRDPTDPSSAPSGVVRAQVVRIGCTAIPDPETTMKLSSSVRGLVRGKAGTFVAVVAIAGLAGTGASVAAGTITSAQIKDGTIQTGDLTKNNFAKFTSTENVVSATTPISTVPAYAG